MNKATQAKAIIPMPRKYKTLITETQLYFLYPVSFLALTIYLTIQCAVLADFDIKKQ